MPESPLDRAAARPPPAPAAVGLARPSGAPRPSPAPSPRLHLRVLRADDHAAVQALFARQQWPQRSRAGWDWALFHSPARQASGAAPGWVLEAGDRLVGFLGNLPQRLWQQGRPVNAATCTALLVDADWRGQGTALVRSFSRQAGTALLYSATANPFSAPLYRLFRYQPVLSPGVDEARRWVADGGAFLAQALRARAGPGAWGGAGLAAALGRTWPRGLRWALSRGGWPSTTPSAALSDLGPAQAWRVQRWCGPADEPGQDWRPAWDDWWQAVLAGHPGHGAGLVADRQPGTVAWRLADPDLPGAVAAWLLRGAGGAMHGLALARALPPWQAAAPRAELMDWCVLPDTPRPAQARLLQAVGDWAAARGLPFVEAKRCTGLAAAQLAALGGRASPLPGEANWQLAAGPREAGGLPNATGPNGLEAGSMTGITSDDWFNSHQAVAGTMAGAPD